MTTPPTLQIITGSTRPGRVGGPIADWFTDLSRQHGKFNVEPVDLREVDLPLLDEPNHPALGRYTHEHTKRWSATVARADAFVFVIPEYNHGLNAATKNAVDFLHTEWRLKPFAIVCYGGASQGLRAAQALKPSLVALGMALAGDVSISLAANPVVNDVFTRSEGLDQAALKVLDDLERLTGPYQALRA
jgi:NAD(P)H-dependent FMN reductase